MTYRTKWSIKFCALISKNPEVLEQLRKKVRDTQGREMHFLKTNLGYFVVFLQQVQTAKVDPRTNTNIRWLEIADAYPPASPNHMLWLETLSSSSRLELWEITNTDPTLKWVRVDMVAYEDVDRMIVQVNPAPEHAIEEMANWYLKTVVNPYMEQRRGKFLPTLGLYPILGTSPVQKIKESSPIPIMPTLPTTVAESDTTKWEMSKSLAISPNLRLNPSAKAFQPSPVPPSAEAPTTVVTGVTGTSQPILRPVPIFPTAG